MTSAACKKPYKCNPYNQQGWLILGYNQQVDKKAENSGKNKEYGAIAFYFDHAEHI